jgi:hypothetical protein
MATFADPGLTQNRRCEKDRSPTDSRAPLFARRVFPPRRRSHESTHFRRTDSRAHFCVDSTSRLRAGRRRRDGFSSRGRRKAGRSERRRSDDAEHGLLCDGVASRTRLAAGRASGGGSTVDAFNAGRTLSARRTGDGRRTYDAVGARSASYGGRAFDALNAGRRIGSAGNAVSPWRSGGAFSAGCAVGTGRAYDAGCSFGRRLLAMPTPRSGGR